MVFHEPPNRLAIHDSQGTPDQVADRPPAGYRENESSKWYLEQSGGENKNFKRCGRGQKGRNHN